MKSARLLGPIIAVLPLIGPTPVTLACDANGGSGLSRGTRLEASLGGSLDVNGVAGIGVVTLMAQPVSLADPGILPRYSREVPVAAFPLHAAALYDDVDLA